MAGLKIGVLGYGSIGKRHATNALELGHQVMVYDPAHSLCSRRTVLNDTDAVIIASPTTQHFEDIIDCVDAGLPMLIEKPIIHPDPKKLELVNSILSNHDKPAYMAFNLRFHETVKLAKDFLPNIGTVLHARFCVAQKTDRPAYLRDGVISNWGSHELDIIRWLLGPCEVTLCHATEDETMADITISHYDNAISVLHCDYITEPEVRCFTINGTFRSVHCNLVSRTTMVKNGASMAFWHSGGSFDINYTTELRHFIDAIQGKKNDLASWFDGVAVARLVIQARQKGGL